MIYAGCNAAITMELERKQHQNEKDLSQVLGSNGS